MRVARHSWRWAGELSSPIALPVQILSRLHLRFAGCGSGHRPAHHHCQHVNHISALMFTRASYAQLPESPRTVISPVPWSIRARMNDTFLCVNHARGDYSHLLMLTRQPFRDFACQSGESSCHCVKPEGPKTDFPYCQTQKRPLHMSTRRAFSATPLPRRKTCFCPSPSAW